MSVELDIFPTIKVPVTWGKLKNRWQALLGNQANEFLGESPLLRVLGSERISGEEDNLLPGLCYYLDLHIPNTLGITVSSNESNIDELAYLEDYGRNLTTEDIQDYAEKWQEVGHYYELTSTGGRGENELYLMIMLASALADICSGHIIVMHSNFFSLNVGVYTPEQFKSARRK